MLCFLALHGQRNKGLFFTNVSEYLQSKRYFLSFLISLFFVFGPRDLPLFQTHITYKNALQFVQHLNTLYCSFR